jgi:acyl-CoA synthetase (AMP-forming)/AMP-acid ligase II
MGKNSAEVLAALPFSSGTTGLPKGVMLSHYNLVVNAFQTIRPNEEAGFRADDVFLCFLPLYHIYGLNVVLNSVLLAGGTIVLMPRFDAQRVCEAIARENITYLMLVPPAMNALCQAAEQGFFPKNHRVRAAKCGAAPLGKSLATRFAESTGIRTAQGYGMTEASPVTHLGFLEPELYRPDSIGYPAALTECRLVDESGNDSKDGLGELVMRGPQFMRGYWKSSQATAEVLRDGWYWSGDVAKRDDDGFFFIVDRRKEMIKYKGFPIAPAEVEAVLLQHPAVRDCGVVGKPDDVAGELPVAFVALHDSIAANGNLEAELCRYVCERLSHYKQPRQIRFVDSIPRNPSGKVLRRELRQKL